MGPTMTRRTTPDSVRDCAGRRLRIWRTALVGMAIVSVTRVASAQIYGVTDDDGHWVLSNHALEADAALVVAPPDEPVPDTRPLAATTALVESAAPGKAAASPAALASASSKLLAPAIREAAHRHAVPVDLLTAVIAVESGFDERAVSGKGAKGLMQLMPDTARRFGVKDVFAADQNLRAGAAYLRTLMNQFPEDLQLALAAYNAGEGAVLRAGRRIPAFPETQQYVRKVLARLAQLSEPANPVRR